jgi:hypothetical protein
MEAISASNTSLLMGAPEGWDSEKYGACNPLPVVKDGSIHYSFWKPSWRDRFLILVGKPIQLAVMGSQPPVALEVHR